MCETADSAGCLGSTEDTAARTSTLSPSPMALLPGAVLSHEEENEMSFAGGDISATDHPASTRPVPLHYADPSGEQWALEAGVGLVDRSDLRVVAVSGPDRRSWLTSITSQLITDMGPGDSRELLILDAQGHIEHAAGVVDDGETSYLITEGFDAPNLVKFLDSMRFALRVSLSIREDLLVFGTAATDSDTALGLPGHRATWADPWPGIEEGGAAYFMGTHPGRGIRMRLHLVGVKQADEFVTSWLGADPKRRPAGLLAWEAMRIAAWRPRLGFETDKRAIPAELDWLRTAVHTDKGCYPGQESVARVINLGHPPRRLVFFQLDGSRGELPERGTTIQLKGRTVGVLTSVTRHADFGPIALGILARTVPADASFDLDGVAAAQEIIVPVDGKSSISPAQRPGFDLVNPDLRRPGAPAIGGLGMLGAR